MDMLMTCVLIAAIGLLLGVVISQNWRRWLS